MDKVRSLQIFQLLRYGAVIGINILLTKTYLSTSQIGIYETLMLLLTSATFFWVSGLLQGTLPIYPTLDEIKKKVFLFNAFVVFVTLSALVAAALYFSESYIVSWVTNLEELPYFGWLCLFLLFNIPSFFIEYIYLLTEQPKRIVQYGVVAFSLQVIVVAVPLFLGYDLEVSFKGLVVLGIIKFLWAVFLIFKYGKWQIDFSLLREYWVVSLPLIAYLLLGGGMEYVDGFIVTSLFDEEKLAVFRYGAKELPVALALANAFSAAIIPTVALNMEGALEDIKERSRPLIHGLFIISIILMLISRPLFPVLFNPDFADSALIFNIYLLILTSRLLFPQTILTGLKKTKVILVVSIFEFILNLTLSLLLAPVYGLAGIAFATVIAFLFEKIALMAYNYIRLNIHPAAYVDFKLYGVYSVALVGAFFASWYLI